MLPPGVKEQTRTLVLTDLIFLSFLCCALRYSAASVIDTSSKYKFLWKLPLEEVEVVKSKAPSLESSTSGLYNLSLL